MAFISYTERPISALSSVGEARAGLIWVDFNFVMSQQAPIRWSLNSWAAQANHGHPSGWVLFGPFFSNFHSKYSPDTSVIPIIKKQNAVGFS